MKQWPQKPSKFYGFCILCALLFWCLSTYHAQKVTMLSKSISLSYSDKIENVSFKKTETQPMPNAAFWTEYKQQSLQDHSKLRSAKSHILQVYGDASLVFPVSFLLGNYPAKTDEEGCSIDRLTAHALWGSQQVMGNTLIWNEKSYVVRGVFDSGSDLVILQSNKEEETPLFYRTELFFPHAKNQLEATQDFLKSSQLPPPSVIVNTPFIGEIATAFSRLPFGILLVVLLFRLLLQLYRTKPYPLQTLWLLLVAFIVTALMVWIGEIQFSIPQALIPTKWSDFEFWSNLAKGFLQSITDVLSIPPTKKDLGILLSLLSSILFALLSVFFLLFALDRLQIKSSKQLLQHHVLYLLALFFFTLLFTKKNAPFSPYRAMWLALPFYTTFDFTLKHYQKKLLGGQNVENKSITL